MADGAQIAENAWASPHSVNHLTVYADREEVVKIICERLAKGEPLAAICRSPELPSYATVYEWQAADPAIGGAFAYARVQGHDAIAKDTMLIADGLLPVQVLDSATGELREIESDATRDKLRVDTRLKLLAKWDPKRYGDSMQLKHADADGKKLDTAPLISELMGILGQAQAAAGDTAINVTPDVKGDK